MNARTMFFGALALIVLAVVVPLWLVSKVIDAFAEAAAIAEEGAE